MVKFAVGDTNPDGKPGNYFSEKCSIMASIDNVDSSFVESNEPRIEVKFRAESSDVEGQVGKERVERFNLTSKAYGRFLELCCACGLYSKPRWRQDIESGNDPEIDEQQLVGRYFCTDIKMVPDKNNPERSWPDIGFNIFGLGDEAADHIPLDADIVREYFANGLPTKEGTLRSLKDRPIGGKAKDAKSKSAAGGTNHGTTQKKKVTTPPEVEGDSEFF